MAHRSEWAKAAIGVLFMLPVLVVLPLTLPEGWRVPLIFPCVLLVAAGLRFIGVLDRGPTRLRGAPSSPSLTGPEAWEGVTVELRLSGDGFGTAAEQQRVYKLEDGLAAAINTNGVGEYDGNAFGNGGVTLYAYGPDADALWAAMQAAIAAFGPSEGSSAMLRYGSVDDLAAKTRVVQLP